MITLGNTEVFGWEAAIRGMRNPMNSWDKSDSELTCAYCNDCYWYDKANADGNGTWCNHTCLRVGKNDLKLMQTLSKAGDDHGKFLRMINVTVDITAPLYWWKEFDTYKVGTVANSCSTMHKIHAKEFTMSDFSYEQLLGWSDERALIGYEEYSNSAIEVLEFVIQALNKFRELYLETKDKKYWWQMIQLLPSSYNQKRTVQLNYQVLKSMFYARKNHKLDEWLHFCDWCYTLPYFKEICGDTIGE